MCRASSLKDVAPVGTILVSTLSAPQHVDELAVIGAAIARCLDDFLMVPVDIANLSSAAFGPFRFSLPLQLG
jgi:hypothetical protein